MLTLNTNAWWNWGYSLSNKEVSTIYPQVEDNILIYPELEYYSSSRPTAFSVNWTVVNAICWIYIMPTYSEIKTSPATDSSTRYYPPVWSVSSVDTFRVWLQTPLTPWITIWKTIVIPNFYYAVGTSTHSSSELLIKVWVLHSDWSITYLTQNSLANTFDNNSNRWVNYNIQVWYTPSYIWYYWKTPLVVKTIWIIIQEWDYVIVEYSWMSTNNLILWCKNPTREIECIRPIQISID
jgi:hypothetical protein